MFKNYLKITWKVLMRNKLFTFISLFGISLTLTILIVGVSFYDYYTKSNYPAYKQEKILYTGKMMLWGDKKGNTYYNQSMGHASYHFLKTYIKTMETPENVSIYSSSYEKVTSFINSRKAELFVKYTDDEFWNILDFKVVSGRTYNLTEVENADRLAVVSETFANEYFGGVETAIGKTFEVFKINYKIAGVVKGASITSQSAYGNVYLPITTTKADLSTKRPIGSYDAMILAKSSSDFNTIKNEFQKSIGEFELPYNKFNYIDFHTITILDKILLYAPTRNKNTFHSVLFIVALVIILIPSLNLINLNTNRINERLSEIGIRKSFGARKSSLVWQFLAENIALTLVGGLLAIIFSYFALKIIQATGIIPSEGILLNYRILFTGLVFCLLFGFISGVFPAYRMSRLQIVESLKEGQS